MNAAPNLILVGPTGAGKSCIGQRLATHFALRFSDTDQLVKQAAGASIAAIFASEGEPRFRARESAALADALATQGVVLATGGGAVLDAGNRELLQARGLVVHLQVSVEQQLRRLRDDHARPLLAHDRERALREMAAVRAPLYAQIADLCLDTDPLNLSQATAALVALLDARWSCPAAAAVRGAGEEP